MTDVYIAPGVRTPFVKSHGAFGGLNALELSVPVAKAMSAQARPDFIVWGQVIPDPTISNIARELVFEASLDPDIPAFSTVLACSTSFVGVMQAAGMIGRGGTHLALVGGVETMSHVPIALKRKVADDLIGMFGRDPAKAAAKLGTLSPAELDLPIHSWANRQSGLSQGEHTEETARRLSISRAEQEHGRSRAIRARSLVRMPGSSMISSYRFGGAIMTRSPAGTRRPNVWRPCRSHSTAKAGRAR